MVAGQVVCIGDVHLGASKRDDLRCRAIEQIISETIALPGLRAYVWLGDLNHGRMTIENRNYLAAVFERMTRHANVVIVRGNHDVAGDLDIFRYVSGRYGVSVFADAQTFPIGMGEDRMCAFVMPHISKATIDYDGLDVAELFPHKRTSVNDPDVRLVVGHAAIAGSVTGIGQPMSAHADLQVTSGMLAPFKPWPAVFGHVHMPQEIDGAYHVGSIVPTDWGETEPKRYLVLDYHGAECHIESRPIATPPMYHVEGELRPGGFAWAVTRGPGGAACDDAPTSWSGKAVRVRYSYRASDQRRVDESLVSQPFHGATELRIEPVIVPDRDVRAPEVARAQTIEDKLRAWASLNSVEVTDGLIEKLCQVNEESP